MADPFDKELSGIVAKAVRAEGVLQGDSVRLHESGTVICIGECLKPLQRSSHSINALFR